MNRRDGVSNSESARWQVVLDQISAAWPPRNFADVTVLVGVSGGADSICLLRALASLRSPDGSGSLVVAHFNHRLRGAASEGDEQFVRDTAQQLGLACEVARAQSTPDSPLLNEQSTNLPGEEALRQLRYQFFESTANRIGARYVALAHTADDQVETVLHNLFRGSGIAGLAGIPTFRSLGADVVVARPMMGLNRSQILAGLESLGQSFRTDESNQSSVYNRNWLRNVLLPQIRERYPQANQSIRRAAMILQDQQRDLKRLGRRYRDELIEKLPGGFRICSESALRVPGKAARPGTCFDSVRSVAHPVIVEMWDELGWPRGALTSLHWDDLWRMIESGSPQSLNLPGSIRATAAVDGSVVVERLQPD